MLLQNKTAVVTGSNKGIGKKILEVFSAHGANIFCCVRENNEEFKFYVNELKKKFKNEIIPVELDLNKEEQIKKASDIILGREEEAIDVDIFSAA